MKLSRTNNSPLQAGIQSLSQGRYYASRTGEVLGKAEAALDGFVGAAMNISHDNEERNVSHQGDELSVKSRKGDRYLERGQVNQSAYNNALSEAATHLTAAREASEPGQDKRRLDTALSTLQSLSANQEVEASVYSIKERLSHDVAGRLTEVKGDQPGRDVSHHGRPLWDLFEASMVQLDDTRGVVQAEEH